MACEVDLWFWSLDVDNVRLSDCASILSDDEEARASRFVHARDRVRFIAARGRLREILGQYMGALPERLQFDYSAYGKPSLAGGPFFSLSHSDGRAALAICRTAAPGLDIEALREVEPAVAERFFSDAECHALGALDCETWPHGFFRCWTRKEAVIKACGLGLSMPLDSFDVSLMPNQPARLLRIEGDDAEAWQMRHIDVSSRMVGALAIRSAQPLAITLREGSVTI